MPPKHIGYYYRGLIVSLIIRATIIVSVQPTDGSPLKSWFDPIQIPLSSHYRQNVLNPDSGR